MVFNGTAAIGAEASSDSHKPQMVGSPPSRDARLGDRNGRFGIMTARALLLGTVPHPNVPGAHPQHLRQRLPRIGPVPHQRP
jgi:hypothetical protein